LGESYSGIHALTDFICDVTKYQQYVGVIENAEVTFLLDTKAFRYEVGLEHFVQGHMMREGPENYLYVLPRVL
jgi:hypothetical protein